MCSNSTYSFFKGHFENETLKALIFETHFWLKITKKQQRNTFFKHFDDQLKDFQVHWTSYLSSAGDGTGLTVSKFEIESLENRLSLFEKKSDAKIAEIQEKYASADEYELWNELENIKSSQLELENIGEFLTHLRYSDEFQKN